MNTELPGCEIRRTKIIRGLLVEEVSKYDAFSYDICWRYNRRRDESTTNGAGPGRQSPPALGPSPKKGRQQIPVTVTKG